VARRKANTYKFLKILVVTCCYNEGAKIQVQLKRYPRERNYDLLILDDGSTDGSLANASGYGATVLSHSKNSGVGRSLKTSFRYALDHGYDVIVIMAGNNKDEPLEIPRLLEPILKDGYDFVQGSRYLPGGTYGNMPIYRRLATQFIHPWLFSLITLRRTTDSTNGFRAIRLSLFRDARINIDQDWLDRYELEPYLFFKAIRLGYKVCEVPCTKIYPAHQLGYTKMQPITGWWSILRPVVYLGLGLKK
jgi:dolichol-phosphate mannosyltransferase